MSLNAKEWLLLPEKEQKKRKDELSPHECFLLRTTYAYIHFSEKEKELLTEEERMRFLREATEKEKQELSKQHMKVFDEMIKKSTSQ